MDFIKLRRLSEKYEARIGSHRGHQRTPPHYFDSLRNAFGAYCNTFNTQNAMYDYYAQGLSRVRWKRQLSDYLDEGNSILTIVAFERFFELFLKDILKKANKNLIYSSQKRYTKTVDLVHDILSGDFTPKMPDGRKITIPFRETLKRFYGLVDLMDLQRQGITDRLVRKFSSIVREYPVLTSKGYKGSLELLNWYRDRILHSGDSLPSLWVLDYLVSQKLIPLIDEITAAHRKDLGGYLFYLTTLTNIDIVKAIRSISFDFSDLKKEKSKEEVFLKLLHLGHLKELGRANLNMNLFMRNNSQATYEYNYKDPKGRGERFAQVERKEHPNAIDIKGCPCCATKSLVVYREKVLDPFSNFKKDMDIDWVKCYTCDYHIRYNVGDPFIFQLTQERIFN